MAGIMDEVSVISARTDQMNFPRSSGPKRKRVIGVSNNTRRMCIAMLAIGLVTVATAQSPNSRIVFGESTLPQASLIERVADDLVSKNYPECLQHKCQTEGRQPRLKKNWQELDCFCDDVCGMYGDCCPDARRAKEKPRKDIECMPLKQYTGLYVVSQCPAEWPKDEARWMCEGHSSKDLKARVLVTNRRTGVTYRNLGCAVCHKDTQEAVSWQMRLECPESLKGSQLKRLNQSSAGEWGVLQVENGREAFHACALDPFMPETVTDVVRKCEPLIDSCPDSWADEQVADFCGAYSARVFHQDIDVQRGNEGNLTYRNPHCALCNGVGASDIICTDQIVNSRFFGDNNFNLQAFTILLDVTEETGSNTVGAKTVCDEGELWDEASIKCRALVCDKGFVLDGDKCEPLQSRVVFSGKDDAIVFPENGKTVVFPDDDKDDTDVDVNAEEATDFQRCPKVYLAHDEFVDRGDGTVIVELYQRTFGPGEFEIREGELAICAVNTNFRKFSDALTIMSLVFLAGSVFCLCCHLVLFCLVPDLRNLSGKNLASLCVCLLLGYICFIAAPFETAASDGCRVLGIIMYTAFIASFFWMNVMAFDVYISLRQASTELRITSGKQRTRFLLYLLYVCAMTAAFVAAAVTTDNSSDEDNPYRPAFGERVCWFSRRRALMVFFAAPLIVIMVANVALFFGSTRIIGKTRQATASMSCGPTKTNLRLYIRLAIITGLSWLTGLVAGWLDFPPLWYVFVILNTLQGVFIFIFFTLADRVRDRIRRDLSRYSRWQAGGGKLEDVPESDVGMPCSDSSALRMTDSRPSA